MRRIGFIFLAVSWSASSASAQVPTGRLEQTVAPTAYRLELELEPQQARFRGRVEIDVRAQGGESSFFLHGRKLRVHKLDVTQAGKTAAARYREVDPSGVARVELPRPLEAGTATLRFEYDAEYASGPAGLYHLKVGDDWYAWTQFEAIDARAAFPCFDQPEFKTPFTVSLLTAPQDLAISNELETGSRPEKRLVRHDFAASAPLPTYLLAIAVGPFDTVESTVPPTPQRPKPLPLRVIATRGQAPSLAYALAQTPAIVALLEAYFDRPFPFSKLDQIASPVMGGAMENAGAIVYDDRIVVMRDAAPIPALQAFGMIAAHEIAHQWFGDLVTPAWWEDIWLNESFANWLGFRIGEQWKPELNIGTGALDKGFEAMDLDALHAGRPIQQPIRSSGEIEAAFDAITYGKGGKVIEMIEGYLGAQKFQKGVRLHMQRFAGGTASSGDFFHALADAAGEPKLVAAMHGFVEQQGVPVVKVERNGAALQLTQRRYAPLGAPAAPETIWTIPLCLRVGDDRKCKLLDKPSASWTVGKPNPRAPILPNAGGHGYFRFELADPEWLLLLGAANQLNAGEALATLDSAWAQWSAGTAPLALLLTAAHAFAGHSDSYVANDVGERLTLLRRRELVTAAQLPTYRKLIAELFGARLQQLGFDAKLGAYANERPDTQRLRGQLVHFMSAEAEDKALNDKLAETAGRWVDGDDSGLDRAFLVDALTAFIHQKGVSGVQRLWDKLKGSRDADLRFRLLNAIGEAGDPAIARWVLERALKPDLRGFEKLRVLMHMARVPATRDLTFNWVTHHFGELIKHTNLSSVGGIFALAEDYCSQADAERVARSLQPQVDKLQRGQLQLARLLEGIRNCAALKSSQQAALQAAFPVRVDAEAASR